MSFNKLLDALNENEVDLLSHCSKELAAIAETLNGEKFYAQIEQSAYWPKWNSPWWSMLYLYETGNIEMVRYSSVESLLKCINKQCLHIFPITEDEVDCEINGFTGTMCFCQLGTLMKVSESSGVDIFNCLPWVNGWFERYQLADGGYNCDEAAYIGSKKSSLISTAPILEGLMAFVKNNPEQKQFDRILKSGIEYFINHKIFLSTSGKQIKSTDWDKLIFPLFYEFDFLRGLELVLDYSLLTNEKLEMVALKPAIELLEKKIKLGIFHSEKTWLGEQVNVEFQNGKAVMNGNMANIPKELGMFCSKTNSLYIYKRLKRNVEKLVELEMRGNFL